MLKPIERTLDSAYSRTKTSQLASTAKDSMATCSRKSRTLIMDGAISASTNTAHQLGYFDAFLALQNVSDCRIVTTQVLTLGPHPKQSLLTPGYNQLSVRLQSDPTEREQVKPIRFRCEVWSSVIQPHIPMLPAPDIISATRQPSTQRPICTLTFFSGCPPIVVPTASQG